MTSIDESGDSPYRHFALLGWGCLLAGLWLPWPRPMFGINLAGCVLMGMALGKLAEIQEGFGKARIAAFVAVGFQAVNALAPAHIVLRRTFFEVTQPYTWFLSELGLAGAIWLMSKAFIELAALRKNIPIRDAAGSRRDLYFAAIILTTFVAGPVTILLSSRVISTTAYQIAWWGAGLFRFTTMALWFALCNRAAQGIEAEDAPF